MKNSHLILTDSEEQLQYYRAVYKEVLKTPEEWEDMLIKESGGLRNNTLQKRPKYKHRRFPKDYKKLFAEYN